MKWEMICEVVNTAETLQARTLVSSPTAADAMTIWGVHEAARRRAVRQDHMPLQHRELVDVIWLEDESDPVAPALAALSNSRTRHFPDHDCLDVPCPRCRANPTEPCRRLGKVGPHYAHKERDVVARLHQMLLEKCER